MIFNRDLVRDRAASIRHSGNDYIQLHIPRPVRFELLESDLREMKCSLCLSVGPNFRNVRLLGGISTSSINDSHHKNPVILHFHRCWCKLQALKHYRKRMVPPIMSDKILPILFLFLLSTSQILLSVFIV